MWRLLYLSRIGSLTHTPFLLFGYLRVIIFGLSHFFPSLYIRKNPPKYIRVYIGGCRETLDRISQVCRHSGYKPCCGAGYVLTPNLLCSALLLPCSMGLFAVRFFFSGSDEDEDSKTKRKRAKKEAKRNAKSNAEAQEAVGAEVRENRTEQVVLFMYIGMYMDYLLCMPRWEP